MKTTTAIIPDRLSTSEYGTYLGVAITVTHDFEVYTITRKELARQIKTSNMYRRSPLLDGGYFNLSKFVRCFQLWYYQNFYFGSNYDTYVGGCLKPVVQSATLKEEKSVKASERKAFIFSKVMSAINSHRDTEINSGNFVTYTQDLLSCGVALEELGEIIYLVLPKTTVGFYVYKPSTEGLVNLKETEKEDWTLISTGSVLLKPSDIFRFSRKVGSAYAAKKLFDSFTVDQKAVEKLNLNAAWIEFLKLVFKDFYLSEYKSYEKHLIYEDEVEVITLTNLVSKIGEEDLPVEEW